MNSATKHKLQKEERREIVEFAVKYLGNGQYNDLLKNEDGQKPIELSEEDPEKQKKILAFLDILEESYLTFRYCRLCEAILYCGD